MHITMPSLLFIFNSYLFLENLFYTVQPNTEWALSSLCMYEKEYPRQGKSQMSKCPTIITVLITIDWNAHHRIVTHKLTKKYNSYNNLHMML